MTYDCIYFASFNKVELTHLRDHIQVVFNIIGKRLHDHRYEREEAHDGIAADQFGRREERGGQEQRHRHDEDLLEHLSNQEYDNNDIGGAVFAAFAC